MKNIIKPLAKSTLIPLGITAAASAAEAGIHKKFLGSGHRRSDSTLHNATLIISNDEMEDIIKIVKSLENSGLLLNGVTEINQNEAEEQKGGFLGMLLGALGANLLGNISASKGIARAGYGNEKSRGVVRAGQENEKV